MQRHHYHSNPVDDSLDLERGLDFDILHLRGRRLGIVNCRNNPVVRIHRCSCHSHNCLADTGRAVGEDTEIAEDTVADIAAADIVAVVARKLDPLEQASALLDLCIDAVELGSSLDCTPFWHLLGNAFVLLVQVDLW